MTTNPGAVALLVGTTDLAAEAGRQAAEGHYDIHGPRLPITLDILAGLYRADPDTVDWTDGAWLVYRDAAMAWWAAATAKAEPMTLGARQRAPTRRMARISEAEAAARIAGHRDTDLPPLGMPDADYETFELAGWPADSDNP